MPIIYEVEVTDQLAQLIEKAFKIAQSDDNAVLMLTKMDLLRYYMMRGCLRTIKSGKL